MKKICFGVIVIAWISLNAFASSVCLVWYDSRGSVVTSCNGQEVKREPTAFALYWTKASATLEELIVKQGYQMLSQSGNTPTWTLLKP